MKRSSLKPGKGFQRKAAKPKRAPVGKPQTRSQVHKGPARDQAHMAKVRDHGCLIFHLSKIPHMACFGRCSAHHTHIFPNSAYGRKPSDYLTAPLCIGHHTGYPADSAHGQDGESGFWEKHGIDLRAWIAGFSLEGAAALALIEKQKG